MSTLLFEQTETNTFSISYFLTFIYFSAKPKPILKCFFSFEVLSSTLRDPVTKDHGLTLCEGPLK